MWIAIIIILLALMAIGFMIRNAPEGYQDNKGFHFGVKQK